MAVRTLYAALARTALGSNPLAMVVGVYCGVPFVISETGGGGADTTCMGIAEERSTSDDPEGTPFGTVYQAFPVAGVLCQTRDDTVYMGWAG